MKKRMSLTAVRFLTAALSAAVMIAAAFAYTGTVTRAENDDLIDRYQIDSEEGSDNVKPQNDSMSLLDDYTYDASFEEEISVFPDSYKNALRRIHTMYPNFTFVADRIGMKLSDAVMTQIENGYKTYQGTYTDDYNTIFKFMDPLTYLYPEYDERYDVYSDAFNPSWHVDADFFMFADHSYSTNQYGEALQNIVGFPDDPPSMQCDFLVNEDMNSIIAASAIHNMNPYVMASTVILEKGWHALANGNGDVSGRVVDKGRVTSATVYAQAGLGTSIATLSNTDVYIVHAGTTTDPSGKTWYKIIYDYDGNLFDGNVHGTPGFVEASNVTGVQYFNTYYNLFSINQTDNNPVVGGIAYAMSHGWTSLAASFEGGAGFCKDAYYDNDQPTYYYMHYNVLNRTSNWWHEYSTGVSAGLKCARILRYGYDYDHDQSLVLRIPVYDTETAHWKQIYGKWYYFESSGALATGWLKYNGDWYYMNQRGVMMTGWQKVEGEWYYLDPEGIMLTGWQKINGDWYYMNSQGVMLTGWQNINGKRYFFDDLGIMLKATFHKEGGKTYFLHASGEMAVGWHLLYGKWYYFNSSGEMATGWNKIKNVWYYFNAEGVMQTRWKYIDGAYYYFNESGKMLSATFYKEGNNTYFLHASGAMAVGWHLLYGNWYYFQPFGEMVTGWFKINNIWYYFDDEGVMQTGWKKLDDEWYYLTPSGAMLTGWHTIDGKDYYFKPSGVMASYEWVKGFWWLGRSGAWEYTWQGSWRRDDTGWRFEDTSGWYAKDTTVIINDVEYTFDEDGYLTE